MKGRPFWLLGARVWKTVIAAFFSLFLDSLRPGALPFYAAIAAVWCIQRSINDSLEGAANREVATICGGLAGMLFLFLEHELGGFPSQVIGYAAIALCLVPIISLSVFIGRERTAFLMCVVFMSVAVAHGTDVHPFLFALNRILDTTIGIGVALLTNVLPHLWKKAVHHIRHDGKEDEADDEY